MKREAPFATEAALCSAFIAWATKHDEVRCYAEWAGWDVLVVLPSRHQIGVQAKLRLNAEVIGQATPDSWGEDKVGPDYRAVLVPTAEGPLLGLAERLGLVVFGYRRFGGTGFAPDLRPPRASYEVAWTDWSPPRRHELPEVETGSVAGSPSPVRLTPWKLRALAVLAELEIVGTTTPKRIRELGVDHRRWIAQRWLEPVSPGVWRRAAKCPPFDSQHAAAYTAALERARRSVPA